MAEDPGYLATADELLAAEEAHFKSDTRPRWGLALSGGGIRSASFALGVLQGLVAGGVLDRIRYLSTVSGGGYIGSSLTWFLHRGLPDGSAAGTGPSNFAFSEGDRTGPRRPIVPFIRDHSSYLLPGRGLDAFSLLGIVIRGIFVSFFVYLAMTIVVMEALLWAGAFTPRSAPAGGLDLRFVRVPVPETIALNPLLWGAVVIALLMLAASLWFSIRTLVYRVGNRGRYKGLIRGQRLIGYFWKGALLLLILGLIPAANGLIQGLVAPLVTGGALTGLGSLAGVYEFSKQLAPQGGGQGRLAGLRIYFGATALIVGFLLIAYSLSTMAPLFVPALSAALVIGLVVNINYVGFHRMYRNRLMEAFMPNGANVRENRWGPATEADGQKLEEVYGDPPNGPYQLINANVVLVASDERRYRDRGGDSFILSPFFCGSEATGWRRTDQYMSSPLRQRSRGSARGLTLPTAMAISGAAVNPHTGAGGRGPTVNPLVSFLMTVLNLRLGYWAPNPGRRPRPTKPNFISPGLRGLFAYGFSERRRSIELTDGGHFDNLGLYELLRRRLPLIIASDAGQDEDFEFADLSNVLERARVDFGVDIVWDEQHPIGDLVSGTGTENLGIPLAKRSYAIGEIVYPAPDGSSEMPDRGLLVYLKTTLSEGLPADIYGYRKQNAAFPDQSTADQFFDEAQFEAYRQLGFESTCTMLTDNEAADPHWIAV